MISLVTGEARRPAVGESRCGDRTLVVASDSLTTIVIADGLGHGPAAAEAADSFCEFARDNAEAPLTALLEEGSRAIAATRGVAAALARVDHEAASLEFVGVGNIALHARCAAPVSAVSMPGVVGRRFRTPRPLQFPLEPGDLLLLCSDGVSKSLHLEDYERLAPPAMAEQIIISESIGRDDASCVSARCLRARPR